MRLNRLPENVVIPKTVSTHSTGQRGRPKKEVDPDIIRNALQHDRRISISALAKVLGIHRNTLRTKIKELDLTTAFDEISDADLDKLIHQYRQEHPDAGRGYVAGHLRSKHVLRLPRNRILQSMRRVDHLGQGIRLHIAAKKIRRPYSVPRPNALWHIDGHHKLILWGIVIHGLADGYSRKVFTCM